MIRRAFVDLATRQVHVRTAGEGQNLLMLHASPGSSKQLEPRIEAFSRTRRVIAPDTPGNGDSTPLAHPAPEVADYAAALVDFLDAAGLERVDVYGSHTGASIALELALRSPERVRRLVLDGLGNPTSEEQAKYLAHYAPEVTPDLMGSHVLWAFMFCRDQYLFWPWFERLAENRRPGGLPDAEVVHDWTLEVLKAIKTYHLGYRAAFRASSSERLPRLEHEVLLIAGEHDPLFESTRQIAGLARRGRFQPLAGGTPPARLAEVVEAFLAGPEPV